MWQETLKNIKAIIFDLDGTIIDSMWIWNQIDEDYAARFNITFPDDYQKNIEGMNIYETAEYTKNTFNISDSIEKMISDWNEMAREKYINEVKTKQGITEFIEFLNSNNIKLGIATSNSKELCMEVLDVHGIKECFEVIITSEDKLKGKPNPDVYLEAAKRLGVSPKDCLVFEDICKGITAGNEAGMTTIAVWDEYSKDSWEEKKSLAKHNIMSYMEIINEIS